MTFDPDLARDEMGLSCQRCTRDKGWCSCVARCGADRCTGAPEADCPPENWTVTYYDYRDGGTKELTVAAGGAGDARVTARNHLEASGAEPHDIWITAASVDGKPADI